MTELMLRLLLSKFFYHSGQDATDPAVQNGVSWNNAWARADDYLNQFNYKSGLHALAQECFEMTELVLITEMNQCYAD